MSEGTKKEINLISYEILLRRAYHIIKVCLISMVIIELISLIIGIIRRDSLSLFLLVGLGLSSIAIYIMCRELIKVICIKCGYMTIRDDEITKIWIRTRGSDDIYFAHLEKNGRISLSESEYKDMKQGDKMFVVKYGTRLFKDVYPQSYTRIDPNLMDFYEE